MYLTTRYSEREEFWFAVPEYIEFRDINKSFAAVGAYVTGEVNLLAPERPRRGQGLTLTTIGIVVGVTGALWLNSVVASLLFGVQPTDEATMTAVIATIAIVAAIACALPAVRASRLDPNVVLRTH